MAILELLQHGLRAAIRAPACSPLAHGFGGSRRRAFRLLIFAQSFGLRFQRGGRPAKRSPSRLGPTKLPLAR